MLGWGGGGDTPGIKFHCKNHKLFCHIGMLCRKISDMLANKEWLTHDWINPPSVDLRESLVRLK